MRVSSSTPESSPGGPVRPVLTIAGSDPSGGAGIQADLRVCLALGIPALSVLTAITVQNTRSVLAVEPISPERIGAQLEAVLSDAAPGVVKIGLLPGGAAVAVVAALLEQVDRTPIVLDPVIASTSGAVFLDSAGQRVLLDRLMPLCALITPNLTEAAALTGLSVQGKESREQAARELQARGARAVLLKGGHSEGNPDDLLLDEDGAAQWFPGKRIDTPHTHGTGCFLSAWIACRLALGDSLPEAIRSAKRGLEAGLQEPVVVGSGRGSPLPPSLQLHDGITHRNRLDRLQGIYVLTDPALQGSRSHEEVARAAFDGGACAVQLRDKTMATPQLIETARSLERLARARGRLFLVNDRVDVALESGADGVHLGPDDMHPRDARRLLGPDLLIGASTGTVEEAKEMAPYASYLGVGAIFGSQTKQDAGEAVGVERLRAIRQAVPGIPLVAIGGITRENIAEVAGAGAEAAAVVSAAVSHTDIAASVRGLERQFRGAPTAGCGCERPAAPRD